MPGAAHHGRGATLAERSRGELIAWIVIFPFVEAGLLVFAAVDTFSNAHEWGLVEWLFRAGWMIVARICLMIGLPGVAWRELRRRKQDRLSANRLPAVGQKSGEPPASGR